MIHRALTLVALHAPDVVWHRLPRSVRLWWAEQWLGRR